MLTELNKSAVIRLQDKEDLQLFREILSLAARKAHEIRQAKHCKMQYTAVNGILDRTEKMIATLNEKVLERGE